MREVVGFLHGRLGNQLFSYATLRAIQQRHGGRLLIDDNCWVAENRLLNYRLAPQLSFMAAGKSMSLAQRLLYFRLIRPYTGRKTPQKRFECYQNRLARHARLGFFIVEDGYLPVPSMEQERIVADGFFQSERFFPGMKTMLMEELMPKYPLLEHNVPLMAQIQDSCSVCLTVRLGDFVGNKVHEVCTPAYYQAAIDQMRQLHPDSQFFLFSDDIEQARVLLRLPEGTVAERGEDPDYEKLRLMAACQHFILSNSAFSWWAQYLSKGENKTVIAPSRWYAVDIPCDIYDEGWVTLPV